MATGPGGCGKLALMRSLIWMGILVAAGACGSVDKTDPENEGVVLISTFEKRLMKVLVTKRFGGDADLLLTRDEAILLKDAIERAIGTMTS